MSPTRKRRHQSSSPSSSQPLPKRFTRSSLNQNQHQETSDTTYPSTAKDKSTPTRKTIKKDSDHSISRGEGSTARMTSSQPIIIDDFDDEGIYFADSDGDLELDDDIQAAITASLRDQQKSDAPPAYSAVKAIELPSPALTDEIRIGRSGWKKDFLTAKDKWTGVGSLEGYAGMLGSITDVYDLEIQSLLEKMLASLQGDDEATGGIPPEFDGSDADEEEAMIVGADPWADEPGRGFEVAKGSNDDLGAGFIQLKE
uniref:Uncharacterized protein n=1 Tax=Kwoniella pini CBS 10737 TaxID=1296096 RepID=A0A1B9HSN7_9TREE|nr:uncharacterized protein I206_07766 [Kwoniella pini CBS 10737]OCF46286.1 hypothetical protein I206_07766 [Kwoniella pini CBS 10737]